MIFYILKIIFRNIFLYLYKNILFIYKIENIYNQYIFIIMKKINNKLLYYFHTFVLMFFITLLCYKYDNIFLLLILLYLILFVLKYFYLYIL